ncbi:GyrI-like domain-containing protein [Clostridium sp. LP20]|uniref:GyrI-like domain-containing protein n=1 Tax=Clostridium sp. LP20 TaxID=3418665 RepID=UPI003EE6AF63
MNYEIVNLKEKMVAGILIKTTNENYKSMIDIGELWGQFLGTGSFLSISSKVNKKTIGLYTDYEGDYTKPFNFITSCEINSSDGLPSEMVIKKIESGKYAKFIINGDVQKAVGEFWTELWNMNLDRKYSSDFEEYQNNSEDLSNQEIHIYIALN